MKKSPKKVNRPSPKAATSNAWMIQDKAIKVLERGVQHLHKQQYTEAVANFKTILESYPQEKELLDRAQVYVKICESRLRRPPVLPKDPADLFYLGVMKANEAEYDEAIGYLEKALESNPKDEKVHYILASTMALKGEREGAVDHLRQAIDLNTLNRVHARNDPDFEPIKDDDGLQNLLYPEEA